MTSFVRSFRTRRLSKAPRRVCNLNVGSEDSTPLQVRGTYEVFYTLLFRSETRTNTKRALQSCECDIWHVSRYHANLNVRADELTGIVVPALHVPSLLWRHKKIACNSDRTRLDDDAPATYLDEALADRMFKRPSSGPSCKLSCTKASFLCEIKSMTLPAKRPVPALAGAST